METIALTSTTREPWNKGKLVGQKTPFKLKEIWAICMRLQLVPESNTRIAAPIHTAVRADR